MNILMKVSLGALSGLFLNSAMATDVIPVGGYNRNLVMIKHTNGQPIFAYIPAPPSTTIAIFTSRGLGAQTQLEAPYYDWGPVRIDRRALTGR